MCTGFNFYMAFAAAVIIAAMVAYIVAQIHAAFFEETDE